ncbi:SIR2 family anti-phage-associated protein [Thalassospira lucentensis]|uniref:SIR2 family anti-phage-associated protein n=1 Tax=Thalassospira lucentensis TaxID=168935 RepID=UPI003AA87885
MFVAFRGGAQVSDETEVKAYLASVLRLENVGLLLGAGASVGAGGRTVAQLWEQFVANRAADAEWLNEHQFVADDEIAFDAENDTHPEPPNVEKMLDTLAVAIAEWERSGDVRANPAKAVRGNLFREVVEAAKLQAAWWGERGANLEDDQLADHRTILQKFSAARQPGQPAPWVFTTNYDLAIEWAAESIDMSVINGFIGVHGRRFSPQSFDLAFRNRQAQGEARFGVYNLYLAKLHGSLTWKECADGTLIEATAPQANTQIEAFMRGERDELGFMVLPSAAKYMQTTGYVLGEVFRRFAEFLAQPQTCLVINGYGFGDEHINRLLLSALLNPTLQIVVYLPEFQRLDQPELPRTVKKILSLRNPRVTVVGGNPEAFLSGLAKHLPEPTIYDESLSAIKRVLAERPEGEE